MNAKLMRSALIVLLLAVQVGAAFVVMLGMRNEAVDQAIGQARESLDKLAGSVVHQAERFLVPAESTIDVAARLIGDGLLDGASTRQLESYFLAEIQARPLLTGMFVGRADGSFVFVTRNETGFLTKAINIQGGQKAVLLTQRGHAQEYQRSWIDPHDDFNPRDRPWYKLARASAGLAWTGAYRLFSTNQLGVSAARPVHFPDGSDAGVLGVNVDVRGLSATIAQVSGAGAGTAALIDETNHIIGFSGPETAQLAGPSRVLAALQPAGSAPLERLLNFATTNGTRPGEGLATTAFLVGAHEHIGLMRPVPVSSGRIRWNLLAQLPVSEFLGPIETSFSRRLRLLMAVLIVTAIIGALALFGLSEPRNPSASELGVDPVTGALTQLEFERRLQEMISSRRGGEAAGQIYVVILDLAGMPAPQSDSAEGREEDPMMGFVKQLKRKIRQHDLVGRGLGDQFTLAVRLDGRADPVETIERIRSEVMAGRIGGASALSQIGITAGIAGFDARAGEALEDLLGRANQALITGKARARNRCYLAPEQHAHWPETVVSTLTAQREARRRDEAPAADETLD